MSILSFSVTAVILTTVANAEHAPNTTKNPVTRFVTVRLPDPRHHPDYARRFVKPPSSDTFGNRVRFATLRGFAMENNRIVRFVEELDKYTKTFDLGDVIWPAYPIIFAENLADLAAEIKKRNLFLFDIWGYVPGSGPGDYWMQFSPPKEALDLLERELGERWLGMDIGEQDGRYIGGYAPQVHSASNDRFQAYLAFQRHFEHMGNELGNKLATLVSLNYGHYFLKEGLYTCIGAETAQALPNSQVYYAFIRGAGKQYGVPWFGNASVWNRWGWKTYDQSDPNGNPPYGPTEGTSLSLLKRLLYSHILYNCAFVGFEAAWFQGDALSPIGQIQKAAHQWTKVVGDPGIIQTPFAFLTDFFSGWTFPRHLYTDHLFRVWGIQPYDAGDYWMDALLDMVYPGYADASYFHDERGFLTPTPYGDSVDCLLSDAEPWILSQYPLIVIAGKLHPSAELQDKLEQYVARGGTLIITAENLRRLPETFCGIEIESTAKRFDAHQRIHVSKTTIEEQHSFEAYPIKSHDKKTAVLASLGGIPLCVERQHGNGTVIAFATPFGLNAETLLNQIPNDTDKPLRRPYAMLQHVRFILDDIFKRFTLFDVGNDLSLIVCRKEKNKYILGIINNHWGPRPFSIRSRCGEIQSVEELTLDTSERSAVGFVPKGLEHENLGENSTDTIAGGDIRVFEVTVQEQHVVEIPAPLAPARKKGRLLTLNPCRTLKENLLARPTFFERFDGISIDWRYLNDREKETLSEESGWLKRQNVRILVDATSGLNLYPDLRLVQNSEDHYQSSVATLRRLLEKMAALGAHELILSLHRQPENSFSREQTLTSFEESLRTLSQDAQSYGVTLYLRESPKFHLPLAQMADLVERVNAPNLFLAPAVAMHLKDAEPIPKNIASRLGIWLISAPQYDATGKPWTFRAPVHTLDNSESLSRILSLRKDVPLVFDAVYENQDDEYRDVVLINEVIK